MSVTLNSGLPEPSISKSEAGLEVPTPNRPELSILALSVFAVEKSRVLSAALKTAASAVGAEELDLPIKASAVIFPETSSFCPGLVVP